MDKKSVVDVSAFMLFEATGDSEIDYDPIPFREFGCDPDGTSTSFMDDHDDAESRSYGLSESYHEDSCGILDDERNVNSKAEDKCGMMIVNEEEDGVYNETWHHKKYDDGDNMQKLKKSTASVDSSERWNPRRNDMQRRQRSTVSADSTDEDLDKEIERNRLFWEACLAS